VNWRNSLRLRLLAGSAIWIVAVLMLSGFVLADLFRQHVATRFEAELQGHLDQLSAVFELAADGTPRLRAELSDPRLRKPFSGLYWQIDRAAPNAQTGVLRSRSLWDSTLAIPADALMDGAVHVHRVNGPDATHLIMVERKIHPADRPDEVYRLIVAADAQSMTGPVDAFVGLLVRALAMLAAGLLVLVAIQLYLGLTPLRRMRDALSAVRAGQTRELQGRYPQEVQPLADELNTLLRHDAEVVGRARTQAGNLAHAVKTPLSILANAAARETGEFGRLVSEQVAIAQRQVDYHLARARAAAATLVPGVRTPLRPVLEGLARVMQRLHAERDMRIDLVVPAELAFAGEEQDLQEMLGNALDNACKWATQHIVVRAALAAQMLIITIDDDGPGLLPAARQAVLERGVRVDEHMPGSGLGLAIVRDLARLYGGNAQLDASPEGGLRVTLTLPAA
jgi:signal transduction histidine kinase